MEINFKEMELIAPALNRIADALELLAGKSNVTHARESAAADQPETPEEKPKKKKAAPKKAASDDELTEQTMRKFAAEAVKKGLKKTTAIIKGITGGETRFADIDPALYPEIHEAISAALGEL